MNRFARWKGFGRRLGLKLRVGWGKWLLFSSAVLLLAFLVVGGFPLGWAINIHAYTGYYFCLILFGLWLYTTWRVVRGVEIGSWLIQHWRGCLTVLIAAVSLHFFQPHLMRVYNDEPAHQMVAKIMHQERENSVPEVGYALAGGLEYGERSLNYRMYFYPFLVSLLHDLTGFRPANGLWLNGLMGVVLFFFVYLGGNIIYRQGGGVLAVLMLLSLPLVDETVTSYGYDITNLAFLAGLLVALWHYAHQRSPESLNWMVVMGLCLAYSRNETVLYLILPVFVFGILLLADDRVNLTWIVALSPLLLLPVLAARVIFKEVMSNLSAYFPHLTDERFFALEYIAPNLARVGQWMFDLSTTVPSSPVLVGLGLLGLVALLTSTLRKWFAGEPVTLSDRVLLAFVLTIAAAFGLVTLAFFWNPVAGEAVRFLLPVHLALAYAGVWLVANTENAQRNLRVVVGAMIVAILWISVPTKMREVRGANLVFAKYAQWGMDWVRAHDERNSLYLTPLNTRFLLHDYPAVDLHRADAEIEKIAQLQAEGYYSDLLVFVIEQYDAVTDTWAPSRPALPLGPHVVTELVAQRRWAYNQRARFLRVVGFVNAEGQTIAIEDLRATKDDFDDFADYWSTMRRLHPGLER